MTKVFGTDFTDCTDEILSMEFQQWNSIRFSLGEFYYKILPINNHEISYPWNLCVLHSKTRVRNDRNIKLFDTDCTDVTA